MVAFLGEGHDFVKERGPHSPQNDTPANIAYLHRVFITYTPVVYR